MKTILILTVLSFYILQIRGRSGLRRHCPENEEYLVCQRSKCKDLPCYQSPPFFCEDDCVSNCFCKAGFSRNENQECVPCFPSGPCSEYEDWTNCITSCHIIKCNETILDSGKDCTQCLRSGCVCREGRRRNDHLQCVEC